MREDDCGKISRRRAMKAGMTATAAAMLAPACAGRKDPEEMEIINREPLPPTRVYPEMPLAVVSAAGVHDSIEKSVREAVMAAGGLDEIERGQKVFIKPNMCGPAIGERFPGRITTNPEVLRAVIRLVKERGAEVMVGDRAMFSTELAMKTSGFARVCKEEGAVAYPWTKAEYIHFSPGKRYWKMGFRFPKILTEVDHFINVPLLKNHGVGGADFTCCMKSFVGVAHPEDRHQGGENELHTRNISEKIAELNLCAKPTINIVDAIEIMVSGGPDGLKKKNSVWTGSNLILASKDRVACDSVALAVLKRYGAEHKVNLPYVEKSVWDQAQIYYGAELGLGQAEADKITVEDVKAARWDEVMDNWS